MMLSGRVCASQLMMISSSLLEAWGAGRHEASVSRGIGDREASVSRGMGGREA